METQANSTPYFEIEQLTSSSEIFSDTMLNSLEHKNVKKKTIYLKQRIIKLWPTHWFDGVWDDLNVKW